jgi:hypothetical protein
MKKLAASTAFFSVPDLAFAHTDGHAGLLENIEHAVSSLHHLWPLGVAAVLLIVARRPLLRALKSRKHD